MRYFFVLLFFGAVHLCTAQEAKHSFHYSDAPLAGILQDIEEAYNVKFSYKTTLVNEVRVSFQAKNKNLRAVIEIIENHTQLSFNQLDDRYYTIGERPIAFCGYLKNSNGQPISGATIYNGIQERGVISDDKGYFTLEEVSREATFSISFLGFETLVIKVRDIKENDCNVYYMALSTEMLQEVVVEEYLSKGISRINDGSIVIRPNQQNILSGLIEPDVLQSTQLLPGIESPGETATGLFIRGGTPDQNLILWDGIKMYNSDHFFGMISAFNPYIIEDVKVYRSGARPEYGDRISGVLDITTDNRVPIRTKGGFGLNFTHADMYLKTPLSEKTGLHLSARRALTDVFDTPTFNQFSEKVFQNSSIRRNQDFFEPEFTNSTEEFNFYDLTVKTVMEFSEKDKLKISGLWTRNKLDYSFQDVEFDDNSSDQLQIRNFGVNGEWSHSINKKTSLGLEAYISHYDFDYAGRDGNGTFQDNISKDNTIKEMGVSLKHDWKISEKWALTNGYQFFVNDVSYQLDVNEFLDTGDASNNTHALFQNVSYSTKYSKIQLGLRSSYYSVLENIFFEPRIYLEHSLSDSFRAKGSFERRGQAISQILELATFTFGLDNQVWALSNGDDIPFLQSVQFSGGFLWDKNDWSIELDGYSKNTKGLTSFTRGFENSSLDFSEGESSTLGLDLFLRKKWNTYTTWLGYTFSNTDFEFEELNNGNSFPGNNDIAHSFTWAHFYKWKNLQLSIGWKYRTGIPFTRALGTNGTGEDTSIDFDVLNSSRLPDYHRLDASITYDFKLSKRVNSPKAKLGFSMLNLYGRENILNKSYNLVQIFDDQGGNTIELEENTRFSLGVTPNILFRLNF